MTDSENTTEDTERKPIPEEPEMLALWRQVGELRDDLVEKIDEWERSDHPIARDHARIAERCGGHGLSDRALREGEDNAKREAERLREELTALDQTIRIGTRDERGERGISLLQLRELVTSRGARRHAAERALTAWWDQPNWVTKEVAERKLRELYPAIHVPDLERLRQQDSDERKDHASWKGGAKFVIPRILRRLDEHET